MYSLVEGDVGGFERFPVCKTSIVSPTHCKVRVGICYVLVDTRFVSEVSDECREGNVPLIINWNILLFKKFG